MDEFNPATRPPETSQPLKHSRFKAWLAARKKLLLITVPIISLVIVLAVFWSINNNQPVSSGQIKIKTTTPTPAVKVASPLTGLLIDADTAKKPVAAVMIENSTDARPQSGLSQAGVVYEAIAEGGITRYMALFQEPFPSVLGPVRSVRPYYADWVSEYNVPIVHAGGSQPGLAKVNSGSFKNVEALVQASGFYRATDRAAPHNLYTKTDLLANLLTKMKFDAAPAFTGLARKDDKPPVATTTPATATVPASTVPAAAAHPKINITFGIAAYNVQYDYDLATNSYKRTNGAAATIDRNTNAQVSVKNVVVLQFPVSYSTQGNGKPETIYKLTGSGKAFFFMDGNAVVGTWSKTSDTAITTYADANGTAITFNRGNTWISAIPTGNAVTY
ncbi:MAG TPA: DUF3048 domain-containing protein [Candidatus Saccharimonadales bacterium]|nr:DUF3048 domain-containing protein [Candidatus Saccharimonadales bacterium]